jgi:hypothetical protein
VLARCVERRGAVGFPFPPVSDEHVRPAVDAMVASLGAAADRLLLATTDEALAGWLLLSTNLTPSPVTGLESCGCRRRWRTAAAEWDRP